ncbi:MAG: glycosyltransferase [Saprospiraceae bacterium]|nr:glycosyltransferase [Saprospiraceae bacterium]
MVVYEVVLLIFTLLCFVLQGYFWIWHFAKVRLESLESSGQTFPVSVIICARNEAHNLQKFLPMVLKQEYPCFEVILVDHASQDNTASIVSNLVESYANLRYVFCSNPVTSKKPALRLGLQSSRYEYILVTDADCKPSSALWIKSMMAPMINGYEIALGAAPIVGGSGLLGCFCQLDASIIFLQYASATNKGQSYMGVGRNMAYVKSLYLQPFHDKHAQYVGGDDDLFVSQFSANKIALVYDQLALMSSPSTGSWSNLFKQKRRHVSVSWEYSLFQKLNLLAFAGSHWGFLAGVLLMVFMKTTLLIPLGLLLLWHILTYMVLHRQTEAFIKGTSWFCLAFAEFMYILFYPLMAIFLMVKPPAKW